jgi:hypothetical protein
MSDEDHVDDNKIDELYLLSDVSEIDSPISDILYTDDLHGAKCCGQGCGGLRPEYYGEPVDIPYDRTPSLPMDGAPMATPVRRDLFVYLNPHLDGHIIGRCYILNTNETIEDFVTVYTPVKKSLFFRGEYGCKYNICRYCNLPNMEHTSDDSAPQYVNRHQMCGRHAYQIDGHCGFLITKWLSEQIDWTRFPEIELYPYPVIDKPLDGRRFFDDPDWDAM